jgi:uncharacterized protein (TIGR03067 family)
MESYLTTAFFGLLFCVHGVLAGDDDLAKELGDFVRAYHKKPEPKRVPGLLDKALDSEFPLNSPLHKGDGRMVLAHAFGHMARGHADLVRVYEAKFAKAQNRGRTFLLESLRLCGDEQTIKHLDGWRKDPAYREHYAIIDDTRRFLADPKRKLPRGRPAVGPEDIDLLWADFLVTGDYAPVARILDILDRPDGLRLRLENWLMKHPEEKKDINEMLAWMKLVKPGTKGQLIDGNLELAALHDSRGYIRSFKGGLFCCVLQDKRIFTREELSKGVELKMFASWSIQEGLQNYPHLASQFKAHCNERPGPTQDLVKRWLRLDEHRPKLTEDMKRLQGTWQALTWEEDGDQSDPKTRAASLKLVRWTFKDDEVHMAVDGGTNKFTYTIDTVNKCKLLKLVQFSPQDAFETSAIYAIEGEMLRACISKKDGGVPTDFTVSPGSERVLVTLKRIP